MRLQTMLSPHLGRLSRYDVIRGLWSRVELGDTEDVQISDEYHMACFE